jgi:hypothetical protein
MDNNDTDTDADTTGTTDASEGARRRIDDMYGGIAAAALAGMLGGCTRDMSQEKAAELENEAQRLADEATLAIARSAAEDGCEVHITSPRISVIVLGAGNVRGMKCSVREADDDVGALRRQIKVLQDELTKANDTIEDFRSAQPYP